MFYLFVYSSRRCEQFAEFEDFTDIEHLGILKHCPTRWLFLLMVVERLLHQLPAVGVLRQPWGWRETRQSEAGGGSLKHPNTKVTLLFLQYILPVLMDFNKLFQVSVIINGAP